MMKRKIWVLALGFCLGIHSVTAQQAETLFEHIQQRREAKKSGNAQPGNDGEVNDSNAPLHLLQPDYAFPYGALTPEVVKIYLDRILTYLEHVTHATVEDKDTGKEITDYNQINANSQLKRGDYRLASYEWGVTYSGMLRVAEVTGDSRYNDYVSTRMNFLAQMVKAFDRPLSEGAEIDVQMRQIMRPHALDDAGAVCASMIRATRSGVVSDVRPLIDNYMNYIMTKEYRLQDGTFARNRPHKNTLWLDDMYMSLPAIVEMGRLTGDPKYYDEAARQIKLFASRMWVPEKKLFRHGWVESMEDHPAFFWGRANGWALLTMCDVLDILPEDHLDRDYILHLLQDHIRGLAAVQSGQGAWHQLLDRVDSYLETSATAIYVYGIAHAINQGWVDGQVYGPVAQLAWEYVSTKINPRGQVEGTCVGTGMAFDPAFYYHRPVNAYAAHSYGPVLLAGAEMIQLISGGAYFPKMNDSAIQYYPEEQTTTEPIFWVE